MFQNKYQSKFLSERQNKYLNFLIDPSFQGVNRLFLLLYQNEDDRKVHTWYYLPKVEIKDYNVMIDGKSFFDQPVNPKRAGGAARGKRGRGRGWQIDPPLVFQKIYLLNREWNRGFLWLLTLS